MAGVGRKSWLTTHSSIHVRHVHRLRPLVLITRRVSGVVLTVAWTWVRLWLSIRRLLVWRFMRWSRVRRIGERRLPIRVMAHWWVVRRHLMIRIRVRVVWWRHLGVVRVHRVVTRLSLVTRVHHGVRVLIAWHLSRRHEGPNTRIVWLCCLTVPRFKRARFLLVWIKIR